MQGLLGHLGQSWTAVASHVLREDKWRRNENSKKARPRVAMQLLDLDLNEMNGRMSRENSAQRILTPATPTTDDCSDVAKSCLIEFEALARRASNCDAMLVT